MADEKSLQASNNDSPVVLMETGRSNIVQESESDVDPDKKVLKHLSYTILVVGAPNIGKSSLISTYTE